MKKVISILLVLCVAVTLFAAGSVKVGGAFNFVTGGTRDFTDYYIEGVKQDPPKETTVSATYNMHGFGFDVAGDFDVAQNLAVWADFNMSFCADAKYNEGGVEISLDEKYKVYKEDLGYGDKAYKKINMISFAAGAAYKLALDPVDVKLGGGLFLDRGLGKVGYKDGDTEEYMQFKSVNFGLALLADANYKFNKNFGVGLTVMPHIGLYNSSTFSLIDITAGNTSTFYESKAKGFKLSFAMPIVVGVSYSF